MIVAIITLSILVVPYYHQARNKQFRASRSWSSLEVGVAINYKQVRKWVWQLLTIMIVIVIYSHDDNDDQSIVAFLRASASALHHMNFD